MQVASFEAAVAEPLAAVAQPLQERRHGYENRKSAQDQQLLLFARTATTTPPNAFGAAPAMVWTTRGCSSFRGRPYFVGFAAQLRNNYVPSMRLVQRLVWFGRPVVVA